MTARNPKCIIIKQGSTYGSGPSSFDRFVERNTALCYIVAMPIAAALGVLLALALWLAVMVPLARI